MIDGGETIRKLVLGAAAYSGLASLAAPFTRGIGAILMLHRVTAAPAKPLGLNRALSITPAFLEAVLTDLKRLGYHFVSMDEAADRINRGTGTGRFAAITADDGYLDNLLEALPVLEKHDAPITVYVAPGLVEGRTEPWWDLVEDIVSAADSVPFRHGDTTSVLDCATPYRKVRAFRRIRRFIATELPEETRTSFVRALAGAAGLDLAASREGVLMNWEEVRELGAHPLATIGAHTVHHPNLSRLSPRAALQEMEESARLIELETGVRPRHFAYPYGDASAAGPREAVLAKQAGYISAVTTRHGMIQPAHATHLHALPRISVDGRYQRAGHLRTMLSGVTTPMANRGKRLVTV